MICWFLNCKDKVDYIWSCFSMFRDWFVSINIYEFCWLNCFKNGIYFDWVVEGSVGFMYRNIKWVWIFVIVL